MNSWNKIQFKGPSRQKQTQEQIKKEWASSVGLGQRHSPQHPHHVKENPWGCIVWKCPPQSKAIRVQSTQTRVTREHVHHGGDVILPTAKLPGDYVTVHHRAG